MNKKNVYKYLDCANLLSQNKYNKNIDKLNNKERDTIIKEWVGIDKEYR